MPKKKNWFDRVKQFFGADTKSKQEKRERRKRWLLGRLKLKFSPALPAPTKPTTKSLRDVEEEQSKYAMAVAVATAVAAEAAVAAAQAAAHVVRLTGAPLSHHKRRDIAAVRIQNAFRGYLARKALGALKGLVRLQALIRGQAVRRQTTMTLRSLRSVMKIQSEVRASRARFPVDYPAFEDKDIVQAKIKKSGERRASENPALWQLQQYSGRDWDSSTLSKEEINTMLKSRLMAALKRERAMEYASARQERRNLQRPSTPIAKETDALNQRWSWLDRWVGAQPSEKDIYENVPVPSPEHNLPEPLLLLDPIHNKKDEESQLRYLARRSFNRSRHSQLRDDESFTSSPFFPGYMASTVSAKARFRSMSTPKQRLEFNDACSDHCTSSAIGLLSPFTSAVSEAGACKTQKSSSRWAPAGPVKSRRSAKNLSFDSECSLVNWDRHNAIIH